jgi:hypothetical protein
MQPCRDTNFMAFFFTSNHLILNIVGFCIFYEVYVFDYKRKF